MTASRNSTLQEIAIADAWVAAHRWTNPKDAEVEYEHARAIMAFARAWRHCQNCGHPDDWHRLDDARNIDVTDRRASFRCLGFAPSVDGPLSACECPDLVHGSTVAA